MEDPPTCRPVLKLGGFSSGLIEFTVFLTYQLP